MIFVLFLLEILFIILYLYIPTITNQIINKNGIVIQKLPVFTDVETLPSIDKVFLLQKLNDKEIYRSNYSISFWLYLTEQSRVTVPDNEPVLFKYGYKDKDGKQHVKPIITYRRSEVSNFIDEIVISFSTNDQSLSKSIIIPKQKWVNVVITYNNNIADVFINGNLERSIDVFTDPPQFNILDKITIGEPNGIIGAICNVIYYTTPLTNTEIVNYYNLLKTRNVPV
jgi:hypothetical protein